MRPKDFFYDLFSWTLVFVGVSLVLWLLVVPWCQSARSVYGKELVVPESLFSLTAAERAGAEDPPVVLLRRERKSDRKNYGRPVEFLLSIDRLGVDRARVREAVDFYNNDPAVVSSILAENLIHLKGSAYPGQWGNIVILGHSSLPFLFDRDNYKTIFSKLPDLSAGDFVKLRFSGEDFFYEVVGKRLVDPERDLRGAFAGPGRRLTLVTCFPPGLTAKRLMVTAKLVSRRTVLSLR